MEEIINKITKEGYEISISIVDNTYLLILNEPITGARAKFQYAILEECLKRAEKWIENVSKIKEIGVTDIEGLLEYEHRNPVMEGKKREWYLCKCGKAMHLDYVPYSTSNPFLYTNCGHKMSEATKFTLDTK